MIVWLIQNLWGCSARALRKANIGEFLEVEEVTSRLYRLLLTKQFAEEVSAVRSQIYQNILKKSKHFKLAVLKFKFVRDENNFYGSILKLFEKKMRSRIICNVVQLVSSSLQQH